MAEGDFKRWLTRGRRRRLGREYFERYEDRYADNTFDVDVLKNDPTRDEQETHRRALQAEFLRPDKGEGWDVVRSQLEALKRPQALYQQDTDNPGTRFNPYDGSFTTDLDAFTRQRASAETLGQDEYGRRLGYDESKAAQDYDFTRREAGLTDLIGDENRDATQENYLARLDAAAGIADEAAARDFGYATDLIAEKDEVDAARKETEANDKERNDLGGQRPDLEFVYKEASELRRDLRDGIASSGQFRGWIESKAGVEFQQRLSKLSAYGGWGFLQASGDSRYSDADLKLAMRMMAHPQNTEDFNEDLLLVMERGIARKLARHDRLSGVSEKVIQERYGDALKGMSDEEFRAIRERYKDIPDDGGAAEAEQFYSDAPQAPRLDPFLRRR